MDWRKRRLSLTPLIDEGLLEFQATSHVKKNSPKPLVISSTVKEEPTENIAVKKEFSAKGRRLVQRKLSSPRTLTWNYLQVQMNLILLFERNRAHLIRLYLTLHLRNLMRNSFLRKREAVHLKKDLLETSSSESEVERIKNLSSPLLVPFRKTQKHPRELLFMSKLTPESLLTLLSVNPSCQRLWPFTANKLEIRLPLRLIGAVRLLSTSKNTSFPSRLPLKLKVTSSLWSDWWRTNISVSTTNRTQIPAESEFTNVFMSFMLLFPVVTLMTSSSNGNKSIFEGWPAELNHSYSQWKAPDLDKLEALLDAGKD